MKMAAQIQILPAPEVDRRLRETVLRFNDAANWIAGIAFDLKIANKVELQRSCYRQVREYFGLSAQMTIRCIAQVCEAYRRDKSIRPQFRANAAIPFDQRIMSFKGDDRVSLLTLDGRTVIPFVAGPRQAELLKHDRGQADLVRREDGKWFLLVTVDVPAREPDRPDGFLGVDLGIVNLAADSDGVRYAGDDVERIRRKHNLQRKRLQRKSSRGAKKKLRRISGKEARFRRHQNHTISRRVVDHARDTSRGIALEDLKGIRERITAHGRDARNQLSGWGFGQLQAFVRYKAELAGVTVVTVNPAGTSCTCAGCGHCSKSNRRSRSEFVCGGCGRRADADQNAALNLALGAQGTRKMPSGLAADLVR